MIKNLVFDMGGVLIDFDPVLFVNRTVDDPDHRALIQRELFRGLEWSQLDRGSLEYETALERICARLPEQLHNPTRRIFAQWHRTMSPIPGMEPLIARLKAAGYSIRLLSNASKQFHEYSKRIGALRHFDGLYLSADHLLLKPDPAIYRDFCREFSLLPEECCFIDDLPCNIEGAVFSGWNGLVFYGDANRLERELRELGLQF